MRFIPAEELEVDTVVGRDIIFTTKAAMLKKGTKLTPRYVEFLKSKGYLGAYVTDEVSKDVEIEETIDPSIFQDGVEAVMDSNVDGMLNVAGDIVKDIVNKRSVCTDLIDLRAFDDYTYHHSVNVAVYAVILGKKLGLKQDELNLLCQAGLLHDIGKSRIPEEVINKPGALTDEEFTLIKKHSQYSYEMLADSRDVASIVKLSVLYHHENENGSGYPNGKEGSELPDLAKIIHAVDVYDALTSKRPYKEPYEPSAAFEYMRGGKGIQFNDNVVDTMVKVIPAYPAGIDVFLSNGERALVIDHSANSSRPKIRIISSGKTVNLATDPEYAAVTIIGSGILPLTGSQGAIEELNEGRSAVRAIKKTVMVVDDTPMSLMQVKAILEEDYNLISFASAIEALGYIKDHDAPDIVIMDVDMPIMDGVTAAKKMRERGLSEVPIIFLSAVSDKDVVISCKQLGRSDYVLKPAKPVYLRERVFEAVYKRRD